MIHTLIITLLLSNQLYSNENIDINPLTNFVSANNQFTFKLLKETNKKLKKYIKRSIIYFVTSIMAEQDLQEL